MVRSRSAAAAAAAEIAGVANCFPRGSHNLPPEKNTQTSALAQAPKYYSTRETDGSIDRRVSACADRSITSPGKQPNNVRRRGQHTAGRYRLGLHDSSPSFWDTGKE